MFVARDEQGRICTASSVPWDEALRHGWQCPECDQPLVYLDTFERKRKLDDGVEVEEEVFRHWNHFKRDDETIEDFCSWRTTDPVSRSQAAYSRRWADFIEARHGFCEVDTFGGALGFVRPFDGIVVLPLVGGWFSRHCEAIVSGALSDGLEPMVVVCVNEHMRRAAGARYVDVKKHVRSAVYQQSEEHWDVLCWDRLSKEGWLTLGFLASFSDIVLGRELSVSRHVFLDYGAFQYWGVGQVSHRTWVSGKSLLAVDSVRGTSHELGLACAGAGDVLSKVGFLRELIDPSRVGHRFEGLGEQA